MKQSESVYASVANLLVGSSGSATVFLQGRIQHSKALRRFKLISKPDFKTSEFRAVIDYSSGQIVPKATLKYWLAPSVLGTKPGKSAESPSSVLSVYSLRTSSACLYLYS